MAKVLILSTGDINGAYEAAYRIASFLHEAGFQVALVVKYKSKGDSFIYQIPAKPLSIATRIKKRIVRKLFPPVIKTNPKYVFLEENESKKYIDEDTILSLIPFTPDLILSGMTDGFSNTNTLAGLHRKTGAKTMLLTVDMSPLTGGCHFAWDCTGYLSGCKDCPAVVRSKDKYWPARNFSIKKKNIDEANIAILAGSGWTLKQARLSGLFKDQEVIHNVNSCIDVNIFNDRHRKFAKSIFNIEEDCKLIFCGSQNINDIRKGFSYFIDSLNILEKLLDKEVKDKIVVLIVGKGGDESIAGKIPFRTHKMDYIKDYRLLSLAYQASDIFVCASIEDSGPMMVSEALACGTPVVGFEMGVVSNMVVNQFNGYKATLMDSNDMALGLKEILLLNAEKIKEYSRNAVTKVVEESSQYHVVDIFKEIIS